MSEEKKVRPLFERRQAFAERQAALQKGIFRDMRPRGSGPQNRDGMPKLPVGQREVKNWPVLDLGDSPRVDRQSWRLLVDGLVERPLSCSFEEFCALPQTEDVSDFHCVTGWSRMDNRWKGVRLTEIAEAVGVLETARHVIIEAYDHAPGTRIPYTTNVTIEEALRPDVLLVHTWEGAPLPHEHGGPVRMITPQLYAWKGAKWVKRITFAAEDEPGFWEERGYSNTAYPWFDDRYSHE
ncbi:MAG: molybdopterin-dependent oxidoreductase [Polyangiaceae bacterium]